MKAVPLSTVDPILLRRIATDMARQLELPAPPSPTAAWQIRNPYSIVFCVQLRLDDWSQRVFAKLPRISHKTLDALPGARADRHARINQIWSDLMRKEHDVLQRASDPQVSDARAGCVRPLAFYADLPALVTLEATGGTLRSAYTRSARVFQSRSNALDLVQRAALCGAWLARFHAFTAVGRGEFDITAHLDYCWARMERIWTLHPGTLSRADALALRDAASALARRCPAEGLRLSGRHNDFASHNIIACGDGGIRVLDFMAFDHGANAYDVCNFWFELEMLRFDPTYSRTVLEQMQHAFLQAYGDIDPMQPDFQLARLRYTLNRLLNELGRTSALRHLTPRWRACVSGLQRWLLDFGKFA